MTRRTAFLLAVAALIPAPSFAQNTYTFDTATTSNSWQNSLNWTGGPANTFAGLNANPNTTANGASTDVAVIGSFSFAAANGLGIDFGTSLNNGVGNDTAANQSLALGAIDFTSATASLQIGNSSTTLAGLLTLNGGTVDGVGNTILANRSTAYDLTLANTNAGPGGGSQTMGVRLGLSNGIIDVATAGRNLTVSSVVSESAANSGFTKTGAGALTLSGVNTYSGPTTINSGIVNANTVTNGSDSATGTGAITINSGGTLAGTGSALGAVTINGGGRIAAGAGSVNQTLTVASATFGSGSLFRAEVTGTGGTADNGLAGASRIAIVGNFDLQPTFSPANPIVIELSGDAGTFVNGQTYTRTIGTLGGMGPIISGAFGSSLTLISGQGVSLIGVNGLQVGTGWEIGINEGGNGEITARFSPVPEPTVVLGLTALGAFAFRGLRRRIPAK